jgi:hypothetical protein
VSPSESVVGRFIFPIPTLNVPRHWTVGRVDFWPGTDLAMLLADAPARGGANRNYAEQIDEMIAAAAGHAVAVIDAPPDDNIVAAMDDVRTALDILRLFQQRSTRDHTTWFSLPGELYQATIWYLATGTTTAVGGMYRGKHSGWTFNNDAYDDWIASVPFQFLSTAAANPTATEGSRRAVVGAQLYSRAAAEHRADLKMLGVIAAMEALLVDHRNQGSQSLTLARNVTWFTCHLPNGPACGRDLDMCPALYIRPKSDKRLRRLRELAKVSPFWECTQWCTVRDWYDQRSTAAHGSNIVNDNMNEAERAEYHFTHYLIEPVLDWLRLHPTNPIGDLQRTIDNVAAPIDWQATLAALDTGNPIPPWAE